MLSEPDVTDDETEETVELGSDAGEELYEIPDDLKDDSDAAPASDAPADPKGPPAKDAEGTQPRDEQGRFAEKDDAPATEEGQPPEPAQAGKPSEQGEPATAIAPDADESEPELEFSFRADGQAIPLKGSRITKDSLIIPREYMADVQRLMSHGVVYQGSYKQRLTEAARQVEATKAEVHEEVERSKHFLTFFADLLDREEAGEPAIESWLDDFRQNRVKLEAAADLAAAKAYRERTYQEPTVQGFDDQPDAQGQSPEEAERFHQELSSALSDRVTQQIQAQGIRGLAPAELTRILDGMTEPEEIDRYFKVALEDIPEHGIKKGQIVALDAVIGKQIKHQAGLILGARQSAQELRNAELKNQRRTPNAIPPTTAVAGGGTPKQKAKVPEFKNKAEMDAWFDTQDPLADL